MKKKKRIAMILLQVVGVAAFTAGLWYFTNSQMQPQTVYQLSQDVPENSQISAEDLTVSKIPKDAVTPNMIKDSKEIVGKYASGKLFKQQYALKGMFVKKDEVDPFKKTDLTKLRKVSIPAEYTDSLGGAIHSGDKVDLVYIGKGENGDNEPFTYSKTIVQSALVYSVTTDSGFRYESKSDRVESDVSSDDEGVTTGTDDGTLATVTLAVTQEQAEEIIARKNSGTIQLVGRFSESKDKNSTGFIIGEYEKVYSGRGLAEANK